MVPPSALQGRLFVNSYNPFAEVTLRARIRQMLHTHQGRDKLYKVALYVLRLAVWSQGSMNNNNFVPADQRGADAFTSLQRHVMTVTNIRKLFRVGRFVAEIVRVRVTLAKCSAIVFSPSASPAMRWFLQSQMLSDLLARVIMVVKCVLDDVAFSSRKAFLHSSLEGKVMKWVARLSIPALVIDLYLNTVRLTQGIRDAQPSAAPTPDGRGSPLTLGPPGSGAFSLLSNYSQADRLRDSEKNRRRSTVGPSPLGSTLPSFRDSATATAFAAAAAAAAAETTAGGGPTATAEGAGAAAATRRSFGVRGAATPSPSQTPPFLSASSTPPPEGGPKQGADAGAAPAAAPTRPAHVRRHSEPTKGTTPMRPVVAPLVPMIAQGDTAASRSSGQPQPQQESQPHDQAQSQREGSGPHTEQDESTQGSSGPTTPMASQLNGSSMIFYSSISAMGPKAGSGSLGGATSIGGAVALSGSGSPSSKLADDYIPVDSYATLFWQDFELHWVCVTQLKLLLDIFVALSMLNDWTRLEGATSCCGLMSGLLSVYRVWTYGR